MIIGWNAESCPYLYSIPCNMIQHLVTVSMRAAIDINLGPQFDTSDITPITEYIMHDKHDGIFV